MCATDERYDVATLNEYSSLCLHALLSPVRTLFGAGDSAHRADAQPLGLELYELLRSAAPDPQLKFLHTAGIFRAASTCLPFLSLFTISFWFLVSDTHVAQFNADTPRSKNVHSIRILFNHRIPTSQRSQFAMGHGILRICLHF